jgi:hypothetical protein
MSVKISNFINDPWRAIAMDAERQQIKRLETAGDYLCAAAAFLGWHGEIEQWNKAKGIK